MEVIKKIKSEGIEKKELSLVSDNSKGTLSFLMMDGTLYNFNREERKKIIEFIKKLDI